MKDNSQARTERLNIRLTMEEKSMLAKKSKECSSGNGTLLIVEAVRSYDSEAMKLKYMDIRQFSDICNAMMTELSRQGNNLNQIAHRLNSMVTEDVGCRQDDDELAVFISDVLTPFIEDFSTFKKDFRERCFHVLDEMIKKG